MIERIVTIFRRRVGELKTSRDKVPLDCKGLDMGVIDSFSAYSDLPFSKVETPQEAERREKKYREAVAEIRKRRAKSVS